MSDAHKARFIIHKERWSIDSDRKYTNISLYVPNYAISFVTEQKGKAIAFDLKLAKRQLINVLLADLMETEDWFETDKDSIG